MYWYEAGLWNVYTSFQVLKSRDKRSIMACLFQVTSVNRKCGLLLTHMYVNMWLLHKLLCFLLLCADFLIQTRLIFCHSHQ